MNSLSDILLAPGRKHTVVADCVVLIEQHVASRGGLKGMALKTGLSMLKSTRPDILPRAVDRLLPVFTEALEPIHREYREGRANGGFETYLQQHCDRAAGALLAAADLRVQHARNESVKSTYRRAARRSRKSWRQCRRWRRCWGGTCPDCRPS